MMMSIFLMCMLVPDVAMRTRHYADDRWLHAAAPFSSEAAREEHAPDEEHAGETPEKHGEAH
jgi:hypothetical protein